MDVSFFVVLVILVHPIVEILHDVAIFPGIIRWLIREAVFGTRDFEGFLEIVNLICIKWSPAIISSLALEPGIWCWQQNLCRLPGACAVVLAIIAMITLVASVPGVVLLLSLASIIFLAFDGLLVI